MSTEKWTVHVLGPDDIIDCETRDAAVKLAHEINAGTVAQLPLSEYTPTTWAVPVPAGRFAYPLSAGQYRRAVGMSDLTSIILDALLGKSRPDGYVGVSYNLAQHISDAVHEAATITTVEQLDALPDLSFVLTSDRCMQRLRGLWFTVDGNGVGIPSAKWHERAFPMRLLWTPEEQR